MAAQAKQAIKSALSRVKAANARLDAKCTSTLRASDLASACRALEPVRQLSDSLKNRKSMELDEAMVYLSDARLCELLMSLLRRMPWTQMRQESEVMVAGLALLSELLFSLFAFLHAATCVRSSQKGAAYTEMRQRCLS